MKRKDRKPCVSQRFPESRTCCLSKCGAYVQCRHTHLTVEITRPSQYHLSWSPVRRNPYSHDGFEKGCGATIDLHTPRVAAVPVGLTRVRSSPQFSFLPASETDITEVYDLFDEIDSWLESELPEAMRWIPPGLHAHFDEHLRSLLAMAREENDFDGFLHYFREPAGDDRQHGPLIRTNEVGYLDGPVQPASKASR